MQPIFADDAPLDARREAAYTRLMGMCPEPFRVMVRPMVRLAMERASDDEIAALLIDIDTLPGLAEAQDVDGITTLARRYGASDEMIATYLPLLNGRT